MTTKYFAPWMIGLSLMGFAACTGGGGGGSSSEDTTLSFTDLQAADVVIGQDNFTDNSANKGGAVGSSGFNDIHGNPAQHNGIYYFPDTTNNRILGYVGLPASNGIAANFVLGQPNFTSISSGTSYSKFKEPRGLYASGGKLFVTDYENHRVLIFNSAPTVTGAGADVVVGQPNPSSSSSACSATKMNNPEDVFVTPDGKLIVTDTGNNRVLIWNSVPTTDGVAANMVLGQGDFTHCAANDADQNGAQDAGPTAATLASPGGIWSDGEKLVIGDFVNARVLIWETFPTSDFQNADLVLGQNSFTNSTSNDDNQDGADDGNPSARTFRGPFNGMASNGTQLLIADRDNDRILIWNEFPTADFTPADNVLGQSDMISATAGTSSTKFNSPTGLLIKSKKLIMADNVGDRYLVFTSN